MATIITFKKTAPTEGYTGKKLRGKITLPDGAGVSYERRLVTDKGVLTSVYDHNDTHRMETSVGTDKGVVYIPAGQTRTGRELGLRHVSRIRNKEA